MLIFILHNSSFQECSRLLQSINIHLIFIGQEISPYIDRVERSEENLTTKCFTGLYHDVIAKEVIQKCDIAVC